MRPSATRICRLSRQIKTPTERERKREKGEEGRKELERSNYFLIREERFNFSRSVFPLLGNRRRHVRQRNYDYEASGINSKKVVGRREWEGREGGANEKARWMKQKGEETRLEESTTENGGW